MATVLVTGGTGTLGRRVVRRLASDGHDVRVLSRQPHPRVPPGAVSYLGDVRTGVGVSDAASGAGVIVHAASDPRRHARSTELEGARHVAKAARLSDAHLVYVSIVGVDQHRFPYYRAKLAAEQEIASSRVRWTVLRATQFHDLIDLALGGRWFIRTPHLRFQPVDVEEVADRLVAVALGAPQGLLPDFGGPEVLSIGDLAATRTEVVGESARLIRVPRWWFVADFDRGRHLTPDHRAGTVTWREWLAAR